MWIIMTYFFIPLGDIGQLPDSSPQYVVRRTQEDNLWPAAVLPTELPPPTDRTGAFFGGGFEKRHRDSR